MQQRCHNVQCKQNDHDSQLVQFICIDRYCQIKNKGMCEICKYGDHLNHSYIKLQQLDDLINQAYLKEQQMNKDIFIKCQNRISKSISILQNHLENLKQQLKQLYKEKKEESLLELLVETYVKNDKLNLEEYNVTRDLVHDSIEQYFGQVNWKQNSYTNQYIKIQKFSIQLLQQTIVFTQNYENFNKLDIKLNQSQIQKYTQLQNNFDTQFDQILNQKDDTSNLEQIIQQKPIELIYKKQLKKISTIDLANNLNLIAIGGSEKFILIINSITAEQLHDLIISTQQVYSVKFSPNDQNLIAAGSKPFEIYSWKVDQFSQPPIIFRGHTSYIYRLIYTRDSQYFLSSSSDQKAILWNIDKKLQQQCYEGHQSNVYGCAISMDMNQIATIGGDGYIILYHTIEGQIQQKWIAHQCEYGGSSVNYINDSLISSGYDGIIKMWNAQTYQLQKEFYGHQKNWIWCVALSNKYFGSICNDYTIKIWNYDSNQAIFTLKNENNGAPGSELSLKNNQFIIATSSESIKIWKMF